MAIFVRKAEENDVNRIIMLLESVAKIHQNGRPDLYRVGTITKYTPEQLVVMMKNVDTPIFVAVDDTDCVVGYTFCKISEYNNSNIFQNHKTLFIDDLCVDETIRGQGIGKILYRYIQEFAKEQSCYNITLNVWEINGPAIEFYQKLGMDVRCRLMEEIL